MKFRVIQSNDPGPITQVDHITSLAKGGWHRPGNLQVISASDNERKGAKLAPEIEQVKRIQPMSRAV
jgi:hypothetical protein